MRYVDLAVRRLIETSALALGALIVLAAGWLGVWTIGSPGCSVDLDHGDGVLVTRVLAGGWVVLEVLLGVVVGSWYARSSDERWGRVGIAVLLPVGAVMLWAAFGGLLEAVLDGLGAGEGSSSCW